MTLAADESVDLFIVYNGTARIEGHASSVVVVNGTANLVGGSAGNVIAIQSQVSVDPSSIVAGDIRTIESSVTGVSATTVTGAVRDIGLDMFVGWRNLGALALIYIAFAVSASWPGSSWRVSPVGRSAPRARSSSRSRSWSSPRVSSVWPRF